MKRIYLYFEAIIQKVIGVYMFVFYRKQWKSFMRLNGFKNKRITDENIYVKKWKRLSSLVSKIDFRFFSNYCDIDQIVPENVMHSMIEPVLNPERFRSYYSDKNSIPILLPNLCVKTILCRVNGGSILDGEFQPITSIDEQLKVNGLILKPSIDSNSGVGITVFRKEGNVYKNNQGRILDSAFLLNYSNNFVLQEIMEQSAFMSQFNSSSVNTIRLFTYRSVKDEKPHVVSGVMRIGGRGSFLDNAHAGGRFIGINVSNGCLGDTTYDYRGTRQEVFNGIDFGQQKFEIPHWDTIEQFAKKVSSLILHMRFLALDIAIDINGRPVLIEFNCQQSSLWLAMYTNQPPFGDYTDEIIEYCYNRSKSN